MHRCQVAKYVIFDSEKIFGKILQKFKNSKILKCGCRKNIVAHSNEFEVST
jgi:hypothetical protein